MAAERRSPYVWCTWLTPILAGSASCEWAVWFKAHFNFEKVERGDFDLHTWTIDHADIVQARKTALEAEGYTVYVENQNQFRLQGRAATLAGKPDLVAVRRDEMRVIDCKTGKRRDSDIEQVLIYMMALPLYHKAWVPDRRLIGEIQYKSGAPVLIPQERFTHDLRTRIATLVGKVGGTTPLAKVPSPAECAWCDIGKPDCPQRLEASDAPVLVSEF